MVSPTNGTYSDIDQLLSFSQWNDPWLISILTEEYARLKMTDDESVMCKRLGSLLFGENAYQSVVKRSTDCQKFRERLLELLHENKDSLNSKNKPNGYNRPSQDGTRNASLLADLDVELLIATGDALADSVVSKIIETATVDFFKGRGITCYDVLVMKNKIRDGLNEGIYLYNSNEELEGVVHLRGSTGLGSIQEEIAVLPAFFIFVDIDVTLDSTLKNELLCDGIAPQVVDAYRQYVEGNRTMTAILLKRFSSQNRLQSNRTITNER